MADAVTSAVTAGTAAALAGAPPDMVVLGSVAGAAVSLWTRESKQIEWTLRWFLGAATHSAIALVAGVVGSTMLVEIAPFYSLIEPLTHAPQWTWAVVIAATSHRAVPAIWDLIKIRAAK